jgi:hypothetical protein
MLSKKVKTLLSNKNYKQAFETPSDNFEYWSDPKERRRPRPSIIGDG